MTLSNQKHLFDLPENPIYLNGAYMSPQLKSVEQVGINHLKKKSQPFSITEIDFFSEKEVLRERFAQLIHEEDAQRIAIIPSVSFGIATAVRNIPFEEGDEIIVLQEQFPSNYYIWQELVKDKKVVIKQIDAPEISEIRGQLWNQRVLEAISPRTKCVAIPHVHWADGTKFDLKTIREYSNDVGAYLIIDGTQSVGALPFSIKEFKPDALVCGGYKWLMGAYGLGVAYYGEKFDHGTPLDNNWMNHEGAENFSNLVNYNHNFKAKAVRYDVGESSNFILVPMLSEGIKQLLNWTPEGIQSYCRQLNQDTLAPLKSEGYFIEDSAFRGDHLFGIYLPSHQSIHSLKLKISEMKISVSYRGNAIRVSPNVYNSKEELEKLVSCFI